MYLTLPSLPPNLGEDLLMKLQASGGGEEQMDEVVRPQWDQPQSPVGVGF